MTPLIWCLNYPVMSHKPNLLLVTATFKNMVTTAILTPLESSVMSLPKYRTELQRIISEHIILITRNNVFIKSLRETGLNEFACFVLLSVNISLGLNLLLQLSSEK